MNLREQKRIGENRREHVRICEKRVRRKKKEEK